MTVTFLDAGVLIQASRGVVPGSRIALSLLDDPERSFVASEFLRLELLPKAVFHGKTAEIGFYNSYFEAVSIWPAVASVVSIALEIAERYGLSALDALHVAAALRGEAAEFITTEKPFRPLFRVREIHVRAMSELA